MAGRRAPPPRARHPPVRRRLRRPLLRSPPARLDVYSRRAWPRGTWPPARSSPGRPAPRVTRPRRRPGPARFGPRLLARAAPAVPRAPRRAAERCRSVATEGTGVPRKAPPMGHDGGVGTRILTVEDDERIRAAVKLALEDEGWTVVESGNGEDAVEQFHRQPADVVLIDLMLPGHGRLRAVPVDPAPERRADHHGHGPQRHPRRGRRARGRAPTTT